MSAVVNDVAFGSQLTVCECNNVSTAEYATEIDWSVRSSVSCNSAAQPAWSPSIAAATARELASNARVFVVCASAAHSAMVCSSICANTQLYKFVPSGNIKYARPKCLRMLKLDA